MKKIVQITSTTLQSNNEHGSYVVIVALCDDGRLYEYAKSVCGQDSGWHKLPLIPDDPAVTQADAEGGPK